MIKWLKAKIRKWQYAQEKKRYAKSTEPWVIVRSDEIDAEKGLKLDLDWNEAFIKHLRAQGVKGTRDEDVVAFWLTMINQQMVANDGSLDEEEDE